VYEKHFTSLLSLLLNTTRSFNLWCNHAHDHDCGANQYVNTTRSFNLWCNASNKKINVRSLSFVP
jgi:hypothetical protein